MTLFTKKSLWILLTFGASLAVPFMLFPTIDLHVALKFYDPTRGFYLAETGWAIFFYELVPWLVRIIATGGIVLLLLHGWHRVHPLKFFCHLPQLRRILFILLALIVGPGLVVNTLFKDQWGRPRPRHVVEMGGTMQYEPPFKISHQCPRNCSFVSGHASVGFFMAAFALLFHKTKLRLVLYSLGILLGLAVGLVRMVQGGHFFSDVVFAGIFTLLVIHLCYWLILEKCYDYAQRSH